MKRTPVTRLDPLTREQIEYLGHQGARRSEHDQPNPSDEQYDVWWHTYYHGIKSDAYLDPGFEPPNPAFDFFKSDLEMQLQAAKSSSEVFKQLARRGVLPPPDIKPAAYGGRHKPTASHRVLVSAIYELPEYMQWWQAENAFRRGYRFALDTYMKGMLLDAVRDEVRENDGMTVKGMRQIASDFKGDPVVHEFFTNLANEFEEDIAPRFSSVSQLMDAVMTAREHSYQQFDPHYKALRWVGGGLAGPRGRR